MTVQEAIGLSGGLIVIASMVPYIRGIFAGEVHPHLFSWLIWSILMGIGFTAQISDGAGPGAWTTAVNCFACLAIVILAIKYGEKEITRLDWIALVTALAAIPVWIATDNAVWAILIAVVIDTVAFVPTWRKSWHKPREEHLAPYICAAVAFVLSLLAMKDVTFITSFYPFALVFLNAGFVAMVFVRKRAFSV